MSEKYISLDLNDPRAGRIGEVIGNSSCNKILELLAEKEMNESARELQKIRKSEKAMPVDCATPLTGAKRLTRRKINLTENVSSKQMQKYTTPIQVSFD